MEGRTELQRVIMHYEKQRAEAIRFKQEAEIVLPFVRAALEELDSATGQVETNENNVMHRVQSQVDSARAAHAPHAVSEAPPLAPSPAYDDSPEFDEVVGQGVRASIASLIEEANNQKAS